jgi:hypothetical protein
LLHRCFFRLLGEFHLSPRLLGFSENHMTGLQLARFEAGRGRHGALSEHKTVRIGSDPGEISGRAFEA